MNLVKISRKRIKVGLQYSFFFLLEKKNKIVVK